MAANRFIEFLTTNLRSPHARCGAYGRAIADFFTAPCC
jgi:hypothetical protein